MRWFSRLAIVALALSPATAQTIGPSNYGPGTVYIGGTTGGSSPPPTCSTPALQFCLAANSMYIGTVGVI